MEMIYKEIPGFQYYFAGSDGNIYSKKGLGHGKDKDSYNNTFRKLKFSLGNSGKGYKQVNIARSNKYITKLVHRLVYRAFKGEIDKNLTVSHLDGDKFNNCPDNLILESQKDNLKRKKQHNTSDDGYRNSRALISKEQLIEIRKLLVTSNMTHQKIGNIFGVSRVFITKIKNKYRYSNV